MKFRYVEYRPKSRRGLSSVVGSLIFVVLMVATFTSLGHSLDSQSDLVETSIQVADTGFKKQQEDFVVAFSAPSEILKVTVTNLGINSLEISTLIITNSSNATAGYPTTVYDIPVETSIVPVNKYSNILSTTPIALSLQNTYEIKVISSLGTIKRGTIVCNDTFCGASGATGLKAEMFLDPPIGIPTKNVTAVMTVTNVGAVDITDVKPTFSDPVIGFPASSSMIGPTFDSDSPVTLGPHQSVFFKWDLVVDGRPGDVWNFTNSATGFDPTLASISSQNTTDNMVLINPNSCGGCQQFGENGTKIILTDDLLIRPSIFMTIPSPFGDSDKKGVWGIHIVNPTSEPVKVHRVAITAIAPGSQDQDIMFDDLNQCDAVSVGSTAYPKVDDLWTCEQQNVVYWEDYTTPMMIDPFSAQTFMAKIKPGSSGANDGETNSQIISANVFSSAGSFGKDDYQTTMIGGSTSKPGIIANVYLSPDINGVGINQTEGMRMNITSGSEQTFNIVLADFDEDNEHAMATGTKLIINVPRGWTDVELIECEGFDDITADSGCTGTPTDIPQVVAHADDSYQIIGTSKEKIGDVNGVVDARTITFNATAPEVNEESMYIMYTLGNGVTDVDDGPIGPVSEIVLQVVP